MSSPIQTIPTTPTAVGVFQSHFGVPPGGQDSKAECEKWQRLCDELLADRARLRAELEKARLDQICSEWEPVPAMEEVFAQVDRSMSIDQLIADLENELEKKP